MSEVRDFTVVELTSAPEAGEHGNVSYFLKLAGIEKNALMRHKGDKPPFKAGDVIQGYYLEEKTSQAGKPYLKLTRPQQQNTNNNSAPRPEDPARAKRIVRQHSQDMAIATLNLAAAIGTWPREAVPDTVSDLVKVVKKLADAFEKDANG